LRDSAASEVIRAREASPSHPVVTPAPIPVSPPSGSLQWLAMPLLVVASAFAHGVVLVVLMLLPAPERLGPVPTAVELDVLAAAPVLAEPPPPPLPPPPPPVEPVVVPEPAAAVTPPRPRRAEPSPPSADPLPAPPAPVLTAGQQGGADWAHPEGQEGGRLDGIPGGTGTGPATSEAVAPPAEIGPPGISRAQLRRILASYIRDTLSRYLHGRIDYPLAASRAGMQGVTMLRVRLARDGRILAVRLSRTSGHAMLDDAALSSVQRLGTMPPPPTEIPWDESQELPLPVTFVVQ
jgi:protein TonB